MVTGTTTGLRERALTSATEAERQRARREELRRLHQHDFDLAWACNALDTRFQERVAPGSLRRVDAVRLAVTLDGERLFLYPTSQRVVLTGRYGCCDGVWESDDLRSVQALGFALQRRDNETAGPCYRCQHSY